MRLGYIVIAIIVLSIINFYCKFISPVITIDFASLSTIDKIINVLLPVPYILLLSTYEPSIVFKISLKNLKEDFPDLYEYYKQLYGRYTVHIQFNDVKILLKTDINSYYKYPEWLWVEQIGNIAYRYGTKLCKLYYDNNNNAVVYSNCPGENPFVLLWPYGQDREQKFIIKKMLFNPLPTQICIEGYWQVTTPSGSYHKESQRITYCSPEIKPILREWKINVTIS